MTDLGPPTLGWVAIRVDALTLAVSVHDHRRHLFFQDRQHLRQKTGDTVDNLLKNHMRNSFSAPNLELDIHDHPFHPFAMRIFWAIIPFWNFPKVDAEPRFVPDDPGYRCERRSHWRRFSLHGTCGMPWDADSKCHWNDGMLLDETQITNWLMFFCFFCVSCCRHHMMVILIQHETPKKTQITWWNLWLIYINIDEPSIKQIRPWKFAVFL